MRRTHPHVSNIERISVDGYEGDALVSWRALVRLECNCYVCAKDGAHHVEIVVALGQVLVRNIATETTFHPRTQSGPFRMYVEDSKREADHIKEP